MTTHATARKLTLNEQAEFLADHNAQLDRLRALNAELVAQLREAAQWIAEREGHKAVQPSIVVRARATLARAGG